MPDKTELLQDKKKYPDGPLLRITFKRKNNFDMVYHIPVPDDDDDDESLAKAGQIVEIYNNAKNSDGEEDKNSDA